MTALDGALCVGRAWLFDSTLRVDQEAAQELCRACPVVDACAAWTAETKHLANYGGGPEGTWAGKRFGRPEGVNKRHDIGVIRGKIGPTRKSGPTPRVSAHGTGPDPCPEPAERRLTAS